MRMTVLVLHYRVDGISDYKSNREDEPTQQEKGAYTKHIRIIREPYRHSPSTFPVIASIAPIEISIIVNVATAPINGITPRIK